MSTGWIIEWLDDEDAQAVADNYLAEGVSRITRPCAEVGE